MWKRICAYIVGIPLVFFGLFYSFSQYTSWQVRVEGRKGLAEIAAREDALDSLGANATLADLERSLHQPNLLLPGAHNTTRVGWACAANDCEAWASFLQTSGVKPDPSAVPALLSIRDHVMQKRLHRVSIGGAYLGESVSKMLEYSKRRGYGNSVAYHHITWDKDWSLIWAETGGKVSLLIFLNDNQIKRVQGDMAGHPQDIRH